MAKYTDKYTNNNTLYLRLRKNATEKKRKTKKYKNKLY